MQRIQLPIDDHDAKFAKHPVAVARVELLDQPHVVAGEFCRRRGKLGRRFGADEMMAGVKARRAHQERKGKAAGGDGFGRAVAGKQAPRQRRHPRHNDVRQAAKPLGIGERVRSCALAPDD